MALFTKLLGSVIRSCAHDSCRWYADYRNAKDFTASESGFSCSMLLATHAIDAHKKQDGTSSRGLVSMTLCLVSSWLLLLDRSSNLFF